MTNFFLNKNKFTILAISLLSIQFTFSQQEIDSTTANTLRLTEGVVTINNDPKIDELIEAKIIQNRKTSNDNFYRIQIYNGPLAGAEEAKKNFRKIHYDWSCDISFESPNYKVRVGKFRNRLEADKYLLEIRKKYSNAFLLQKKSSK